MTVLDYSSPRYLSREFRHALRPFRPAPKSDILRFAVKTMKFLIAQQRLTRTAMFSLDAPPDFSDYDLIVVGSDEVWNLKHPWLGGNSLFFGERIAPKKLISYAASFGSYSSADGLSSEWVTRLQRFDRISVRDKNSSILVEAHLGSCPALVLDPCLQFEPTPRPDTPAASTQPFLLVYGNRFNPGVIQKTKSWAKENKLRIISVGYRNEWADESRITAGPDDFVRFFKEARAVVTSYFHGCIFSLRFNRPFAAQLSDYRANKIQGLLDLLGATHRIVDGPSARPLDQLLSTSIESEVHSAIRNRRGFSAGYLADCLA